MWKSSDACFQTGDCLFEHIQGLPGLCQWQATVVDITNNNQVPQFLCLLTQMDSSGEAPNTSIHPYIHTFIHPCIHASMHPYIHTSIHTSIHPYILTYIHPCIHPYIHPSNYITLHYITLHHITSHYITLHYITLHYIHIHSYSFIFRCVYILYIDTNILESAAVYEMHQLFCWLESDLWNTCFTCLFIHPPKMGDPFYMTIISRHRSLTGTPKDRSKLPDWKSLLKPEWRAALRADEKAAWRRVPQIGALLAYHGTKWWLWMVKRFMGPAFSSMVFTKTGVVI